MNKILVNTSAVLSLLVISFSFPVNAIGGPEKSENTTSESQKVNAPLTQQPAVNGSVGVGVYNPEIAAIMDAMQRNGYTPTLPQTTSTATSSAVYFMNPPQGN